MEYRKKNQRKCLKKIYMCVCVYIYIYVCVCVCVNKDGNHNIRRTQSNVYHVQCGIRNQLDVT